MTWDILNKKVNTESPETAKAKRLEQRLELEGIFKRCFTSDEGAKVLQHLSKQFIYNNDTPLESANVNYVAAYKNGEAGVIKYIIHLLTERDDARQEKA